MVFNISIELAVPCKYSSFECQIFNMLKKNKLFQQEKFLKAYLRDLAKVESEIMLN